MGHVVMWSCGHLVGTALLSVVLVAMLKGNGQAAAPKKWTVLVYQGGDNDLETALIKDLNEMERVGSTQDVSIVSQLSRSPGFDRTNGDWTGARRYLITRDPNESAQGRPNNQIVSQLLEDLGSVNMGKEETLVDFVRFGVSRFPAQRYLIILSDHGAGVRPFEPRFALGPRLPSRGVVFDDTFNDFLSNSEIKSGFARIKQIIGRNVDVVGFDASEMSLIEVAYQMKDSMNFWIASQLSEPNDGYPYDLFLSELSNSPDISTQEFLKRFVQHYIDSYLPDQPTNGAGSSVTISVYNMKNIPSAAEAISKLADELLRRLGSVADAGTGKTWDELISDLRSQTQSFSELIYRDIFHFAQLLRSKAPDDAVRAAAQKVMDVNGPSAGGALLFEAHRTGYDINVDNAHGIAIYFPVVEQFDERYLKDLDFARETKWGQFLAARGGEDTLPPTIVFIYPKQRATIPITRPVVMAVVRDAAAGLEPNSIEVEVNGSPLPNEAFNLDLRTAQLTIIPTHPLTAGSHQLTVRARDKKNNQGSAALTLSVSPAHLPAGLSMVGLPVSVTEGDPGKVLKEPAVKTARWDVSIQDYRIFPNDPFATFTPPDALTNPATVSSPPAGLGYWILLPKTVTFTHPGTPILPNSQYSVALKTAPNGQPSWNMFSNPFPVSVLWKDVRVQDGGRTMTLREAQSLRLIDTKLFHYLPNRANPNLPGEYELLQGDALQLNPFEAYWLIARANVFLLIPGPLFEEEVRTPALPLLATPRPSLENRVPRLKNRSASEWRLRLTALCGGVQDSFNFLGMAPHASNGLDDADALKPPPIPGAPVRLFFLQPGRAGYGHINTNINININYNYAADIRKTGAKAVWDVLVECAANEDVMVAWEGTNQVPSRYDLILEDLDGGQRIPMRLISSHTFRTGGFQGAQVRRLRIIAQPRGEGRLVISNLRIQPNRGQGVSITYTLSRSAAVTVTIKTLAGRKVRTVASSRQFPAGNSVLVWDGWDGNGRAMPPAPYLCEVIAVDEIGRPVRALRTFMTR